MRGSFYGLNVSLSGLFAAQRNLDTINHNTANMGANGYSRQAVNQSAASPFRLYNATGMVGSGTEVLSVARVRDIYLDKKYWFQSSIDGEWSQKSATMAEIETRIDETSSKGYSTTMNEFYDVLEEMSKDPQNLSIRAVVKENAQSLAGYFNTLSTSLEKIQEDLNFDVKAKVELINSIGHRIETLNEQIYQIEILNEHANDLRDARDLLVDELSSLVDVEIGEHNYGKLPSGADDMRFYVYVGGVCFLQHFNNKGSVVNEMKCVERQAKVNEEDVPGLFDIEWTKPAGQGEMVKISGGALRGLLDTRDGNVMLAQKTRYDMLGSNITLTINLPGVGPEPSDGLDVDVDIDFDGFVADVSQMTADDIAAYVQERINAELADAGADVRPDNLAVAATDANGFFTIDLSGVDVDGAAEGIQPPTVSALVFTARAQLKQELALPEREAPTNPATSILSGETDVVNAVVTPLYKGIPYYQRKLNEYVRTYAMAFNEGFVDSNTDKVIDADEVLTGHADGYNITQSEGEPPAGVRFFTMVDSRGLPVGTGDFLAMPDGRMPSLYGLDASSPEYEANINAIRNAYSKVTAKNFSVSADIMNDPSLIATSAKAGDVEDNTNLLSVISQRFNRHMFSEGSSEDFMQSLTTDAAVNTSQADYMLDRQDKFMALLTQNRMSISGVSKDEELANMVRQQSAYSASATMINTFNSIYDTLINKLGLI